MLIIRVKDDGIGIREEDKENLFMDYKDMHLGKENNQHSNGLGLSISKSILK
jgi:K+-sensing histidine kinase KdpD